MWAFIAKSILRYRIPVLIVLGLMTGFMVYKAQEVKLFYGLPQMLPETDVTFQEHIEFTERFKTESTIFVIGLEEDLFSRPGLFNAWSRLGRKISAIEGVDTIVSVCNLLTVQKDTANERFEVATLAPMSVSNQAELDSVRGIGLRPPLLPGVDFQRFYPRQPDGDFAEQCEVQLAGTWAVV